MTILLVSQTSTTTLLVGLFLLMASACCGAPYTPCPDSIEENQPCNVDLFADRPCPHVDGTIFKCTEHFTLTLTDITSTWENKGLYDGLFPHPANSCENRKDDEDYVFEGEKRCSDLITQADRKFYCHSNGNVRANCGVCQENTNPDFEVPGENKKMKCDDLITQQDYRQYCKNGSRPAHGTCGFCTKKTNWDYTWPGNRTCDALTTTTQEDRDTNCKVPNVRDNCPKSCKSYPCCPKNEPKAGSKCGPRRHNSRLVCGYGDYKFFEDSEVCQPAKAYKCAIANDGPGVEEYAWELAFDNSGRDSGLECNASDCPGVKVEKEEISGHGSCHPRPQPGSRCSSDISCSYDFVRKGDKTNFKCEKQYSSECINLGDVKISPYEEFGYDWGNRWFTDLKWNGEFTDVEFPLSFSYFQLENYRKALELPTPKTGVFLEEFESPCTGPYKDIAIIEEDQYSCTAFPTFLGEVYLWFGYWKICPKEKPNNGDSCTGLSMWCTYEFKSTKDGDCVPSKSSFCSPDDYEWMSFSYIVDGEQCTPEPGSTIEYSNRFKFY